MSTDTWKLYKQGLREEEIEEGMEKGKIEGSEEIKLEIARAMLSEKFSIKDIIKVTDLSEDKINSLR